MIGTSPAVGMTNSMPATANATIQPMLLPTSGPISGNSQARAAPSSRTRTMYSGMRRTDMRTKISIQRTNAFEAVVPDASRLGRQRCDFCFGGFRFLRRHHAGSPDSRGRTPSGRRATMRKRRPIPAENEAHEHQRRRIEHRVAEPEGDRRAGRRLALAQAHNHRRRAARAHHAGHREHAARRRRAEARLAQHARDPVGRQQRLDAEPSNRPSTIACQMALP